MQFFLHTYVSNNLIFELATANEKNNSEKIMSVFTSFKILLYMHMEVAR